MAEPTPTFYLFHGTDEFTRAETLASFKRRLGPPDTVDLNTTLLDGGRLTLAELRHDCDAIPFMAEKRLVIVRGLLTRLAARKSNPPRRQSTWPPWPITSPACPRRPAWYSSRRNPCRPATPSSDWLNRRSGAMSSDLTRRRQRHCPGGS